MSSRDSDDGQAPVIADRAAENLPEVASEQLSGPGAAGLAEEHQIITENVVEPVIEEVAAPVLEV